MIAWCGSRVDGLEWLSERCAGLETLEVSGSLCIEQLDRLCEQRPRRLVLAVENRVSYPAAEIQHLEQRWPEIPWGLAVGSWYDGSRRTGIGAPHHLSLAWYRWWDGWRPWLIGENASLLGPWPRMRFSQELGSSPADEHLRPMHCGVILCNCRQTAQGWLLQLGSAATKTRVFSISEFENSVDQESQAPDWMLWDDTCLDTFAGDGCLRGVCSLLVSIRQRYPRTLIFMATCMPRWCDWEQWRGAGADELIAKPSANRLIPTILSTLRF